MAGSALREALGPNGQLIVSLIPEFELVIGKQPPYPDLPPQEAQNRFQMVFQQFLGASFARPDQPLVLFLDDLQWLDAATLDLLEHLVTHSEVRDLLSSVPTGATRSVSTHPLMRTLEEIARQGAGSGNRARRLSVDSIVSSSPNALHCEPDRARPLGTASGAEKTGGNPFFTIQFFTALAEEGLSLSTRSRRRGNGISIASAPRDIPITWWTLWPEKLNRLSETDAGGPEGSWPVWGIVAESGTLALVRQGPDGRRGIDVRRQSALDSFSAGRDVYNFTSRPGPGGRLWAHPRRVACQPPSSDRAFARCENDRRTRSRRRYSISSTSSMQAVT